MKWIKRFSIKQWLVILAIVLMIIIVVYGISSAFHSSPKTTKIGLYNIGELATQAAYVTAVDVIQDPRKLFGAKIPFTQSHYVYSYDFVIKAGFRVEDIVPIEKEKTVIFKLPNPEVLSNESKLNSLKIYLEDESVFNQVTMDESNKAFIKLQEQAEKDAVANGVLEGAKENTKTILAGLFSNQFDPEEYTYEFQFEQGANEK